MIITAPLPPSAWRQIGWEGGEVLGDGAHVYVYLQRTDGRIAIGGRGVPYRFGSRTCGAGDTAPATVASLHERLVAMFPAAAGVEIDHAWSGVLGVSREWGAPAAPLGARAAAVGGNPRHLRAVSAGRSARAPLGVTLAARAHRGCGHRPALRWPLALAEGLPHGRRRRGAGNLQRLGAAQRAGQHERPLQRGQHRDRELPRSLR
jgi:hypothetical protein